MRTLHLGPAFVAGVLLVGANVQAGESFSLEAGIYVFRSSDFPPVKVLSGAASAETPGMVFRSPATAQFGDVTLSLIGDGYSWGADNKPPARFSRIATPVVPLKTGKPVTFSSTAPVQYLEKVGDGSLKVRVIAEDSPDAPHCRLTVTMGTAVAPGEDLRLACELDIVTVTAREKIPDVALDVGKPVLACFKDKLDPLVRLGEWAAFLWSAPNGSDFSLLVLLKVDSGAGLNPSVAAPAEDRPMTAAELDQFVTYYYRQPRPELVARAIEALGPSGFAKDRAEVFVGFFAEVLAANPEQKAAWRKLARQQDNLVQEVFYSALQLSRLGALLAASEHSVRQNDRYWGGFFASGNPAYLRKVVDHVRFVDHLDPGGFWVGATALWSLARNATEHPLVRTTLEAVRTDTDRRTRNLVGDVLTKDPEVIRREILDLWELHPGKGPNPWGYTSDGSHTGWVGSQGGAAPASSNLSPTPPAGPVRP